MVYLGQARGLAVTTYFSKEQSRRLTVEYETGIMKQASLVVDPCEGTRYRAVVYII